jgi:hypothetical protein
MPRLWRPLDMAAATRVSTRLQLQWMPPRVQAHQSTIQMMQVRLVPCLLPTSLLGRHLHSAALPAPLVGCIVQLSDVI